MRLCRVSDYEAINSALETAVGIYRRIEFSGLTLSSINVCGGVRQEADHCGRKGERSWGKFVRMILSPRERAKINVGRGRLNRGPEPIKD